MKTCLVTVSLIVLSCLVTPWIARGEDGYKLPNLNPFSSKGKTTTGAQATPPTSGWHWPKLWTSSSTAKSKTRSRSKQPSTWQKMTSGTKNMMDKTTDALNPWDDEKKTAPAPQITGSNSAFSQASAKKSVAKKNSLMPTMPWSSDDSDQKPKTVNEFLSQPRLSP